jgi:hypothetical protein
VNVVTEVAEAAEEWGTLADDWSRSAEEEGGGSVVGRTRPDRPEDVGTGVPERRLGLRPDDKITLRGSRWVVGTRVAVRADDGGTFFEVVVMS